jgi:hypothetical protein
MTEVQIGDWTRAVAGVLESRSTTFNRNGYTETINRGIFGMLQYTVSDDLGTRTGRNRDQVLETLGMDEGQLRTWAQNRGGLLEGRSVTINAIGHNETISRGLFGVLQYTVTDDKGMRTGRNREQVMGTLTMDASELRDWAEASSGILEGRSVTLNQDGYTETINRATLGRLQYTVTDDLGSRTGHNRDEVMETLDMDAAGLRAWAEDSGAWLDGRSATINALGHTETVSRGTLGMLQYTVTDDQGSRTGRNRDQVMSTLRMNEAQLRIWGEAAAGVLEGRTVTLNRDGHTETIGRGMLGILQYTVTDAQGNRTSRNRASVIATLGMNEAQLRTWGEAAAGVLEGRTVTLNRDGHTETISRGMLGSLQYTVTDDRGSRTSRNREQVLTTLDMSESALRTWVEDRGAWLEGRTVTLNGDGHTETISRGMFGILQYTVSDEHGIRSGRNRDQVMSTLDMDEAELRAWATDGAGIVEGRSVTINALGHTEMISRGPLGVLQYTITDERGSRTGRNREAILSTLGMNEAQLRTWVSDNGFWLQGRSLTNLKANFGLVFLF